MQVVEREIEDSRLNEQVVGGGLGRRRHQSRLILSMSSILIGGGESV